MMTHGIPGKGVHRRNQKSCWKETYEDQGPSGSWSTE